MNYYELLGLQQNLLHHARSLFLYRSPSTPRCLERRGLRYDCDGDSI